METLAQPKIFQAQVLLTNAIILAFNNNSVVRLVPEAPGGNRIIIPVLLTGIRNAGTGYTAADATGIWLTYTEDFSDGGVLEDAIPYTFFTSGQSAVIVVPSENIMNLDIEDYAINKPVYLWKGDPFAGGAAGNQFRFIFAYMILDLSTGSFVSN